MTAENPILRSSAPHTYTLLLILEWSSVLAGVLLQMLTRGYYRPGLYLALFLLAVSWITRWVRIRRFSRSTQLEIPLLLFLLSLLIGYFAAPDPDTAFARLSLFLAAISFFYAMVNSPARSLDLILNLLIVVLAFTSLFLFSQYEWSQEVARFRVNKLIGIPLNQVIPNLNLDLPPWNVMRNILASLLGLFLPILALQFYRIINQGKISAKTSRGRLGRINLLLLILLAFLILLDLVLTESRAPWVAYAAILLLAVWWWLSHRIGERMRFSFQTVFIAGTILGIMFSLVFINILSRNKQLISIIPGPNTFTGRVEISSQSSYLAGDTPYTGGGLGAFTALYSFYIRVTPYSAFTSEDTGSDLYHYVQVEQGWLGLITLISLLVIPLYLGLVRINYPETVDRGLVIAGLIGIGIIILRGFIHALLGASHAIPFLLLPAGLIFAGLGSTNGSSIRIHLTRRWISASAIIILLLLAYLLIAPAPRSAWYANLGAIRMARIQLAGWPTRTWEDGSSLPALAPAEALFQKAIALNTNNRTANHRLGLIYLLRQDFSSASRFLETAYWANPQHRGVIKSLGYALVWTGEVERAIELLRMIPESAQELNAYILWWQTQERPDLSDRAAEAQMRLLSSP